MPPRKSDASKVATGDEGTPGQEQPPREGINIEDLNLPKSIVTRLAKGVLPPNTQIQGNAMLAMTKSATVFVNYLASHASENALQQSRKTIAPQDVFKALDDLEFPGFKPRLEAELARFNELQTDKRNTYRRRVAAAREEGDGEGETQSADGERLDSDGRPAAKKARVELGGVDDSGDMELPDAGEREEEEEEEHDDDHGDEAEDDEDGEEEREDQEEQLEDAEHAAADAEDEALDNGDDSE